MLVGGYFAYVTTNSVSELLLGWHERRGLLVKSLEFTVKLALELGGHRRKLVLLGALSLHFLQLFLGSDGLSNFRSQQLTPVALLSKAVVDVVAVQADPVTHSFRRLFFRLHLVVLGPAGDSSKFIHSCLNEVLDLLATISLFCLSILLVRLCAQQYEWIRGRFALLSLRVDLSATALSFGNSGWRCRLEGCGRRYLRVITRRCGCQFFHWKGCWRHHHFRSFNFSRCLDFLLDRLRRLDYNKLSALLRLGLWHLFNGLSLLASSMVESRHEQMARLAFSVVSRLHLLTSVAVRTAWEVVVLTLLAYPSVVRELEPVLLFFLNRLYYTLDWGLHSSLLRLSLLTS